MLKKYLISSLLISFILTGCTKHGDKPVINKASTVTSSSEVKSGTKTVSNRTVIDILNSDGKLDIIGANGLISYLEQRQIKAQVKAPNVVVRSFVRHGEVSPITITVNGEEFGEGSEHNRYSVDLSVLPTGEVTYVTGDTFTPLYTNICNYYGIEDIVKPANDRTGILGYLYPRFMLYYMYENNFCETIGSTSEEHILKYIERQKSVQL